MLWMGMIFFFSSQPSDESGAVSEGFSFRMMNTTGLFLHLPIDQEKLREIAQAADHYVRKGAHMTEYAILAVFLYVWAGRRPLPPLRRAEIAAGIAALYACTDEIHQLFVAGRAGMFSDVLVDSLGAVLGLAVVLLVTGIKAGRRR